MADKPTPKLPAMTFEELARIVDQGMHKAFVEAEARERARKKAGLRVVKPPKSA